VSRRTLIVSALGALSVLGAAAALLAAGAPARASAIGASASSSSASVGELTVSFTAATAITGFTVHIITARGTDVLDLPEADFTMTSPPGTASSTWALGQAITTSQLLLGTYSITVDATDTGGDSVTGQPAGTLDYLIQPTVTLDASTKVLSYSSPATTLSGAVTGLLPDGSTRPITGQQVLVTNPQGQSLQTQTDASGDFTTSASFAGTFTASVSGSTLAPDSSAPVTVTAATTPTALTASVSTARTSYGQQVTVSGQLSYQPGTTLQGLAGMPVVVVAPGDPQLSVPVTGPDGSFTARFAATQPGPVLVYFNNAQHQESGSIPYLAPAEAATDTITVDRQTSLTQFAASVSTSRMVSVHGCVGIAHLPPSVGGGVAGAVTIQYAASKAGPWRRLGTISHLSSPASGSCGIATVEGAFRGSYAVKLARAYYRASFAPKSGANLLRSVSAPALAWKYLTKITSLKVSARRVANGSKVTVSGQLLQHTKRWIPYDRRVVQIVYRKPRAKNAYWIVRVTTNSAGKFTATFRDTFSATWSAFYPGNATHYDSSSTRIKVTAS
jgi:hypothetical protein